MTSLSVSARLEYCSFYVAGSHDVDIPVNLKGGPFAANQDCLSVGCRGWQEAETEILLSTKNEFAPRGDPALDMLLLTPEKQVLLFDANHPELLHLAVDTDKTRIRVWTNHDTEPDHIVIIAGG